MKTMRPHHAVKRHMFRSPLLALALLLAAVPALPQAASRYTVEIVVFRNGGDGGALPDAGPLLPAGGDDVSATLVAASRLNGAAAKLRGAGDFRVLAHAAWSQVPTAFNSGRGVSAARLGLDGAGMSGKVLVYRGQYLSLGLDLTIEEGGRRYRINELRRNVKPDQIHYFDHPAVGVIAIVSAGD